MNRQLKYLISLIFAGSLGVFGSTLALADDSVTYIKAEIPKITSDQKWTPAAVKGARIIQASAKRKAQKVLTDLKNSGVVHLEVKRESKSLTPRDWKFAQSPEFEKFNHAVSYSGFDGSKKEIVTGTFAPRGFQSVADYLVSIRTGNCRLAFSWWNSDTWWEPDCKVEVVSPKAYLVAALQSHLGAEGMFNVSDFWLMVSLNDIMESHRNYSIRNGYLYPEGASGDPIQLVKPAVKTWPGYEITIDPSNKWHATFRSVPPNLQAIIDNGKYTVENRRGWIDFRASF